MAPAFSASTASGPAPKMLVSSAVPEPASSRANSPLAVPTCAGACVRFAKKPSRRAAAGAAGAAAAAPGRGTVVVAAAPSTSRPSRPVPPASSARRPGPRCGGSAVYLMVSMVGVSFCIGVRFCGVVLGVGFGGPFGRPARRRACCRTAGRSPGTPRCGGGARTARWAVRRPAAAARCRCRSVPGWPRAAARSPPGPAPRRCPSPGPARSRCRA